MPQAESRAPGWRGRDGPCGSVPVLEQELDQVGRGVEVPPCRPDVLRSGGRDAREEVRGAEPVSGVRTGHDGPRRAVMVLDQGPLALGLGIGVGAFPDRPDVGGRDLEHPPEPRLTSGRFGTRTAVQRRPSQCSASGRRDARTSSIPTAQASVGPDAETPRNQMFAIWFPPGSRRHPSIGP